MTDKSKDKKAARRVQEQTGRSYQSCLNAVRKKLDEGKDVETVVSEVVAETRAGGSRT
jgi:hypothetical protein